MNFPNPNSVISYIDKIKSEILISKQIDFLNYEIIKSLNESVNKNEFDRQVFNEESIERIKYSIEELLVLSNNNEISNNFFSFPLTLGSKNQNNIESTESTGKYISFNEILKTSQLLNNKDKDEHSKVYLIEESLFKSKEKAVLNYLFTEEEIKKYKISFNQEQNPIENEDKRKERKINNNNLEKVNIQNIIDSTNKVNNNKKIQNTKDDDDDMENEIILSMVKQLKKNVIDYGSIIKSDTNKLKETEENLNESNTKTRSEVKKLENVNKYDSIGLFTQIIYSIIVIISFIICLIAMRIFPRFV